MRLSYIYWKLIANADYVLATDGITGLHEEAWSWKSSASFVQCLNLGLATHAD